jgi:hypothetical protein
MEDRSQRSSTEALEAVFLFTACTIIGLLSGLIGYFTPHLAFALLSVLPYVFTISLCMVEVLLSHGLRSRLPGILRKGLRPYPMFGFNRLDDSVLRDWPTSIGRMRLVSTILGLVLAILPLTDEPPPSSQLLAADCYKTPPNPDIVGLGVRYSIYTLLFCLFISLIVASFHRQQSGTKELGCMVLISTQTSHIQVSALLS